MADKLTPMMQQYMSVKKEYPDAVVLFRMGDFYEMFGDDARVAAPVLEIVLTSRDKNADEKMPMCGVPHHSVESYIAKLIHKNFKVVICDQVEDPKKAKGLVKRDVVRVITPGTVLESNLLSARENNYLASMATYKKSGGLAVLDLSTGEFLATEISLKDGDLKALYTEVDQWGPAELLYPENWPRLPMNSSPRLNPLDEWIYNLEYATDSICKQFHLAGLDGMGMDAMPSVIMAAGALIHYLQETRVKDMDHIKPVRIVFNQDYVYLDPATRRNLELTRTLMGGQREGSLLHFIDLTVTPMGARELKSRLEKPLRNTSTIRKRLDQVQAFYGNDVTRTDIRTRLKHVADLERITGRIATRVAHGKDLAALRDSLSELPVITELLREPDDDHLKELAREIDLLPDLLRLLEAGLVDDPPAGVKDGNLIRDHYHAELDELRSAARDGKKWIAQLQAAERDRTGIASLKIKFNKVFGYHIEVTRTHLDKIPDDYIRRQTLVNAERFVTPELKEMEEKLLGAEERMAALEYELFAAIREQIAVEIRRIQQTAQILAVVDVSAALAELAGAFRYRRPDITENHHLEISNGRHPVVERISDRESFVPNDVLMDTDQHRLLILTGPNMAGKSTYIRQVALIVLLAQMGSFVPADSARVGVVDRIFTRVGASDNLAGGQSTFMVEMSEAANILNNATEKSLVILDEIGRGTSTFDGLSIAWAVAEYLHTVKARTLFATHYHELTDLSRKLDGVKNYNVEVREWNDQVVFLRKVVPGGVDRSYGIQVARLAGIPHSVLARAKEVLATLETKEPGRLPDALADLRSKPRGAVQLSLFQDQNSELIEAIRRLDLNNVTPIEALNLIQEWKKHI